MGRLLRNRFAGGGGGAWRMNGRGIKLHRHIAVKLCCSSSTCMYGHRLFLISILISKYESTE